MKLSQKGVKAAKTANQRNVSKTSLVLGVLIFSVIGILFFMWYTARNQDEKIDILVFASDVEQGTYITEDMLTTKTWLKAQYDKEALVKIGGDDARAILSAADKDRFLSYNLYADHFMRAGTPIYWDAFTKEAPKKNSYLYQMDGELIKLDISADVFGDMIVPGDKVNIRCLYTESNYNVPDYDEYLAIKDSGLDEGTTTEKLIMLFSEVAILDMLNSSGESIFDYYYEFITWPTSKQLAALEDDTFKANTKPAQILLSVTAEEADNYMRIQNKGPKYMLTLLPRESSNIILDALTELNNTTGGIIDATVEQNIEEAMKEK